MSSHLRTKNLVLPIEEDKETTKEKQTRITGERAWSLLCISGNEMGGKHLVV